MMMMVVMIDKVNKKYPIPIRNRFIHSLTQSINHSSFLFLPHSLHHKCDEQKTKKAPDTHTRRPRHNADVRAVPSLVQLLPP